MNFNDLKLESHPSPLVPQQAFYTAECGLQFHILEMMRFTSGGWGICITETDANELENMGNIYKEPMDYLSEGDIEEYINNACEDYQRRIR